MIQIRTAILFFLAVSCCWQMARAQLPTDPVQGYVYVEAFELRKEVAFYLSATGESYGELITPVIQQKLIADFKERLGKANPMTVDGETVAMELDRLQFVKIIPDLGVFPDDREQIPAAEALIAAVYAKSMDGFPKQIDLEWDFFPGQTKEVNVTFVSPSTRATKLYSAEQRRHSWLVPSSETEPGLLEFEVITESPKIAIPLVSVGLIILVLLAGLGSRVLRQPKAIAACGLVAILGMLGAFALWGVAEAKVPDPTVKPELPTEDEATEIVNALLRNVYHGFDFREEERIYDTLAHSVDGDSLEKLYLAMRKGLELENQGGPRIKIKSVDLRSCYPEELGERRGFRADADWVAVGDVTHWGHTHQRINVYRAWLTVEPIEGRWKLTEIDVIEEGRL